MVGIQAVPSAVNNAQAVWLVVLAAGPTLAFLWVAHARHGREVEPGLLLSAFASGAATAVLAGIAERVASFALDVHPRMASSSFLIAFALVASVEELVKCVAIRTYFDRLGPEPTIRATFLIGIAVACGFAAAENIVYVFDNSRYGFAVSLLRHFTAVPLHLMNGLIFATYLGLRIVRPDPQAAAKGFAIVWITHGFYDFVIFERQMTGLLLIAIFSVQIAYIHYGLREARRAEETTHG